MPHCPHAVWSLGGVRRPLGPGTRARVEWLLCSWPGSRAALCLPLPPPPQASSGSPRLQWPQLGQLQGQMGLGLGGVAVPHTPQSQHPMGPGHSQEGFLEAGSLIILFL